MKTLRLILFFGCLFIFLGCKETQVQKQAKAKRPYKFRPFSFAYFNTTNEMVRLRSVQVLSNDAAGGSMWAGGSGSSVSYSRKDCTPEALLGSPANFVWWNVTDPSNRAALYVPEDPSDECQASLSFPEFDVEASAWRCFYTLLNDNTWVGKFAGTLAKQPGTTAKPAPAGGDSWLHCHFRNLTDKEVLLSKWETKIVTKDHEIEPGIRFLPADKRFHGFSANCHKGSIYRLAPGDTLQIAWSFEKKELNTPAMKKETFVFPDFAAEKKNWYCYFSLNEKEEWTATFEGVPEDGQTVDR